MITHLVGGETAHEHSDGVDVAGQASFPATPRLVAGRGGGRALSFPTDTYHQTRVRGLATTGGIKFSLMIPSRPAANTQIMVMRDAGSVFKAYLLLRTDGTFDVYNQADAFIGNTGYAIPAATWVNCWLTWDSPTSNLKFYAQPDDGTPPGAARFNSNSFPGPISIFEFGGSPWSAGAAAVLYDDVIGFDDPAALPHQDAVVLLHRPVSDSARGSWTTGVGGAGNLWDAVNNTPPVGAAAGGETAVSQIVETAHALNDSYDAVVESYGAKGAILGDTVLAAQGVIAYGSAANGVSVVSNPAIADVAGAAPGALVAAYPTNWARLVTAIANNPTVSLDAQPAVRVRRADAAAVTDQVAFMGLLSAVRISRVTVDPGVWGSRL